MYCRSENRFQIWPQLFSKAICKLNRYKWEDNPNFDFDTLVGDGSVMYALTGLIPETIQINKMLPTDWDKIQQLLDDDEYKNDSCYCCCYSKSKHEFLPQCNRLNTTNDIIKNPTPAESFSMI